MKNRRFGWYSILWDFARCESIATYNSDSYMWPNLPKLAYFTASDNWGTVHFSSMHVAACAYHTCQYFTSLLLLGIIIRHVWHAGMLWWLLIGTGGTVWVFRNHHMTSQWDQPLNWLLYRYHLPAYLCSWSWSVYADCKPCHYMAPYHPYMIACGIEYTGRITVGNSFAELVHWEIL